MPVESPVYGTVDGARLGQILLIDAYQEFGQEGATERQQANQDLLNDLLDRLLSGDDLVSAAQAIASTAPGRHVQIWMRSPELQRLAVESGAAGIVDDPGTGDWSAVYTQNGNQSKVDVFQQRNVLVTAQVAEDGSARVTQQMTVTNATPPERPGGPARARRLRDVVAEGGLPPVRARHGAELQRVLPVGLRGAAVQEPPAARRRMGG